MKIRLRTGRVTALGVRRLGALELTVEIDGEGEAQAIAYPDLVGDVEVDDEVLLNTSAVALELGTGGLHLVIAIGRLQTSELDPKGGHVMKARYTPLQVPAHSVEETDRDVLEASSGLGGTPVVAAPLHSMIAHIAAGAKVAGAERVIYVMTDGASLPGGFSRLVPSLRDAGMLDGFITCGQAFGGEREAVTVWTAMLAAKELLGADVIVVADGPGNLGTDTRWGSSALGSGNVLNAAEALGGRPIAPLRVSFADPRPRHQGVSHHSITILSDVCTAQANVAVPTLEAPERQQVWQSLRAAQLERKHRLIEVLGWPAVHHLEEAGIQVTSMGRSLEDDPIYFLAAGGAGILAGRMAAGSRAWQNQIED